MQKLLVDEIYKSVRGVTPNTAASDGAEVTISGWIRTNRSNNNIGFISLNDGSCFNCCQVIYESNKIDNYTDITKLLTGCSIEVTGKLVMTPGAQQPFEINASSVVLLGS